MSRTTFEKLGIPYEERDGIFYPVLVAGTEKADIDAGKYGRMWIKYIREEYPMRCRGKKKLLLTEMLRYQGWKRILMLSLIEMLR